MTRLLVQLRGFWVSVSKPFFFYLVHSACACRRICESGCVHFWKWSCLIFVILFVHNSAWCPVLLNLTHIFFTFVLCLLCSECGVCCCVCCSCVCGSLSGHWQLCWTQNHRSVGHKRAAERVASSRWAWWRNERWREWWVFQTLWPAERWGGAASCLVRVAPVVLRVISRVVDSLLKLHGSRIQHNSEQERMSTQDDEGQWIIHLKVPNSPKSITVITSWWWELLSPFMASLPLGA